MVEIQLFIDQAPAAVNRFVELVRNDFYRGTSVHRVVPGKLLQTGKPPSPSRVVSFDGLPDEFHPDLRHDSEGIVAMSNSGNQHGGTSGSEFYITLGPLPEHDGLNPDGTPKDCQNERISCHVVFGKVIRGMNFVNATAPGAHSFALREGDAIRAIEIVTQYHPLSKAAAEPPDCRNGIVLPDPQRRPQLVRECEILLEIKDTLAGDAKLNWRDSHKMRDWRGVILGDGFRHVKRLVLTGRGMTGTIPPELGELKDMVTFSLSDNKLTGEIPVELTNLRKLSYFTLGGNQLTGEIPPEVGKLTNLEFFRLRDNNLTGGIPREIARMKKLIDLHLHGNQLTGPIPPEFSGLHRMRRLVLNHNQLTGSIPPEFGKLRELLELRLHENDLSGEIPRELGWLEKLWFLELQSNQLEGNIPPELGYLHNLLELRLNRNRLSGPIPPELGRLINLRVLDLSNNRLAGNIPPEMGDLLKLQELHLRGNDFEGCIPTDLRRFGDNLAFLPYCDDP